MSPPVLLAGVDGCPAGWLACLVDPTGDRPPEIRLFPRFADLLAEAPAVVAVDMPIGLPDHVGPGGRGPERLVRPLLGERQSSVFSIPSREAVYAGEDLDEPAAYAAACAAAQRTSDPPKKVSKQGFHLFPKIRELDRLLTPDLAIRVVESHPEVAFTVLNGGRHMALPKKVKNRPNPPGLDERRDLLARFGIPRAITAARPPRGAGPDDLLDACVLALVAARVLRGEAVSFPEVPARDARGLPIAITA
jgi:predicted RNase H-like nuclease